MKLLIYLFILQLSGSISLRLTTAPPCVPDINVRAVLCPYKQDSMSVKYCPKCTSGTCCILGNVGLRAIDKNYTIISFKIVVRGICDDSSNRIEGENNGAVFNEVQWMLTKICPGV